ncbi:WD40 repeat domain-containing protein, partial [Candidatus Bipolaricaulota bacterium]|nr:WD40 repeat domain-containing protein [Candidatus Bipolaricaulota bacterium]
MNNKRAWKQVGAFLSITCMLAFGVYAVEPITAENAGDLIEIAVIDDSTRVVYSVAWSSDGTLLASGGDDGRLRLMDTSTWEIVRTITAHYAAIWGVAWSPDGTRIASAGSDGFVRLWDPQTGEKVLEIPGTPAYSVAWTPSGDLLAIGHRTGQVRIVDPLTGNELASWRDHIEGGHSTEVIAVAWSPDGSTLASGGIDYAVRLWDREGNSLAVFRADIAIRNDINGLAWSPNGSLLTAAGQAASIRVWDVAMETEIAAHRTNYGSWTRGVAYSSSGSILATTGSDMALTLWSVGDGARLAFIRGHDAPIWSVAWSPDGTMLATGSGHFQSGSGDTSVRIWGIP